jgi:hypothetical protein
MRWWVVTWAGCAALWMALVDRPPVDEIVAGVVAATLATAFARLVRRDEEGGVLRALRRLPGALWRSVTDLRLLALAIGRRRPGRIVERPLPPGPTSVTQAIESIGANTVALRADPDRGAMVVHELVAPEER